MLVNGRNAWNMSANIDGTIWQKLNNTNGRVYVTEDILNWVDPFDQDIES